MNWPHPPPARTPSSATPARSAAPSLPPSGYAVNYVSGSPNTITLTKSTSDYNTWGAPYGLTAGSEGLDLDGDGVKNQAEYAFGLIPNSGASVNPITSPLNKTTGKFSYTRRATPASTGLTYTVWTSVDLVTWTLDSTATSSQTGHRHRRSESKPWKPPSPARSRSPNPNSSSKSAPTEILSWNQIPTPTPKQNKP